MKRKTKAELQKELKELSREFNLMKEDRDQYQREGRSHKGKIEGLEEQLEENKRILQGFKDNHREIACIAKTAMVTLFPIFYKESFAQKDMMPEGPPEFMALHFIHYKSEADAPMYMNGHIFEGVHHPPVLILIREKAPLSKPLKPLSRKLPFSLKERTDNFMWLVIPMTKARFQPICNFQKIEQHPLRIF